MFKTVKTFVNAFKFLKNEIGPLDKAILSYTPLITNPLEALRADRQLRDETRKARKYLAIIHPEIDPLRRMLYARYMAWQELQPEAWNQYVEDLRKLASETD